MKLRNIGYAAIIAMTAAAFVIGSAVPCDAKAKKKKAETAPPPPVCFIADGSAVCATKGGMKFTYKNSCYASKDGAKVVSNKACPVKAMKAGKKKMAPKKAAKPAMKKPAAAKPAKKKP